MKHSISGIICFINCRSIAMATNGKMIVVAMCIFINALSRCCGGSSVGGDYGAGPSAPQIIGNERFVEEVERAWHESHLGKGQYLIRGGWVYADPNNPQHIFLRLASKCRSKPSTPLQAKRDPEDVEIYLDYPENDDDDEYPPPPFGYKLVADFHTHPFPNVYQKPGKDDIRRAFNRGVPGIVYSRRGIFYYGPRRRSSTAGTVGYPGNCFSSRDIYYGPNPFCHPSIVRDQEEL